MRAAVLGGAPGLITVADGLPEPEAGHGEVIVRVSVVGVCGSDLSLVSGHRPAPAARWIPGHEATGRIVATGPGVPAARAGQRVVIEPNFPCLGCGPCAAGLTSACGQRVSLGFSAPGTLADLIAVPSRFAWEIPGDWSETDAVCTEPLTVALAAIRRSDAAPGQRCLVIGAGSQGALLCAALVARGISTAVLEPHLGRRELAEDLGAVPVTDEGGYDLVFETSGSAAGVGAGIARAGVAATVLLIGLYPGPVPVDAETVVRRQLRIVGSLTYDHPGDFAAAIRESGPALAPGRVLRACYPLADAEHAFRQARSTPGKTWIQLRDVPLHVAARADTSN